MTRHVVLTFVAGVALLVAGCAGPTADRDPLGPSDLDAAVAGIVDVGEDLTVALGDEPAMIGMLSVPWSFQTVVSEPPPLAVERTADQDLPRGILAFDTDTSTWVEVGVSLDLEFHWSFVDADGAPRDAHLVIDWGMTEDVGDGMGGTTEVPTDGVSVALTIDDDPAGAFDVAVDWYAAPTCPDGVLVPTSGLVDGSIGVDATIALNAVGFTLADDAFDTSGEIVATAGSNAIGVDWNVGLGIDLTRGTDCFVEDVDVIDGSVAVSVFGTSAGTTTRLALGFGFSDIQTGEYDEPVSVAISGGQLRLNGTLVVAFAGRLDDANANGIPGDALTLTFADGTTMTLEAYLETYVEEITATVGRALALLR